LARVERSGVDERSKRIERLFEWPIVIAAILVIPVIYIEQSEHGEPWSTLATVANWVIWLLFLAEVVVMLAVVPDRRRWARTHPLELAIVVLTRPFLPGSMQADAPAHSGPTSAGPTDADRTAPSETGHPAAESHTSVASTASGHHHSRARPSRSSYGFRSG
jgi:hypothetical protein